VPKGTIQFPSLFYKIMTPQEHIAQMMNEVLEGTDCFLVSHKVTPTNNYKFYLDADSGFPLEKSIRINRRMRKMIEEAGLYPEGDYSLEVSSPGVDAPLKLLRQYKKNVGRLLEVVLNDEASTTVEARLTAVDDVNLYLEKALKTKKNSPAATEPIVIPIADIRQATVCIEF
jgi:ribosome maturation factor RimP